MNRLRRTAVASAAIVAISVVAVGCGSKHATREPFFTVREVRTAFANQGFRLDVLDAASAGMLTGGVDRNDLKKEPILLEPAGGLDTSPLVLQVVVFRRLDDARLGANSFERAANLEHSADRLRVKRIGNVLVTYLRHRRGAIKVARVLTTLAGTAPSAGRKRLATSARRVANAVTQVLLHSSDWRAALRQARPLAEPQALNEIESWYARPDPGEIALYQSRFRVVAGPRPGCSAHLGLPPFASPGKVCYRLRIVGQAVKDPLNPGVGSIGFGTLAMTIDASRKPLRVHDFIFTGGGSRCRLGGTGPYGCDSLERRLIRRGRKWLPWL